MQEKFRSSLHPGLRKSHLENKHLSTREHLYFNSKKIPIHKKDSKITFPMYVYRDKSRTVCMTQPLADEFPLDTEQPVKIVWLEANMTDEVTRFTFTYKPDPRINSIHPAVTIPRYGD